MLMTSKPSSDVDGEQLEQTFMHVQSFRLDQSNVDNECVRHWTLRGWVS